MRTITRTLKNWLGGTPAARPLPRTRLHAEPLEAREVPALFANFDWKMEDRFGRDDNKDGRIDIHNNPAFVRAATFNVTFDARSSHTTAGLSKVGWAVHQDGKLVTTLAGPVVTAKLPQGQYDVTATVVNAKNEVSSQVQPVRVRDLLIVSMGDSYGSGEGNPDVPRTATSPAKWADSPGAAQAHRSGKSGAAQAALALEQADPHTSVTFVSVARSGDGIRDGILNPRRFVMSEAHGKDEWTIPMYDAIDVATGKPVLPDIARTAADLADPLSLFEHPGSGAGELAELVGIVGNREIDALTISAGGNDAGFVPGLTAMLLGEYKSLAAINASDAGKAFNLGVADLKNDYAALAKGIDAMLNVAPGNVYLCEYANPVLNGSGQVGGAILTDILPGKSVTGAELEFGKIAHAKLNAAVKAGAEANGFRFISGVAEASKTHGLAAPAHEQWFNTATASRVNQGPFTDPAAAGAAAGAVAAMVTILANPLVSINTLGAAPALAAALANASAATAVGILDKMSTNGTAHPNAKGWEAIGKYIRLALEPRLLDRDVTVTGTEGGDLIELSPTTATTWAVKVNGVVRALGANAGVTGLALRGGGGNDTIVVRAAGLPSNVVNVAGGAGNDTFQLRDGKVVIADGGAGTDTLDYSFATQRVYVNLGADKTATGATLVLGVENAVGGAGDDILVGGPGANTLTGNAGRDLLIGGLGSDVLNGGAKDDIVIRDATTADASKSTLYAVLDNWTTDTITGTQIINGVPVPYTIVRSVAMKKTSINAMLSRIDDGVVDTLGVMVDADWVW